MPKKSYIRILLLFGMALIFSIVGCVDTSVQPIPSTIDYRSEVKVVNFAQGVGSADFVLRNADGTTLQFGTIPFGDEDNAASSFMDVPAGSKTLSFNSESFQFSVEVDKKVRLFVVGPSSDRSVVKMTQRYLFQTKDDQNDLFRPDTAAVAFFNGSVDVTVDAIHAVSADVDTTLEFSTPVELGDAVPYRYLKAGSYSMEVIAGEDTVATFQANLESQKRYTAAIYDTQANLKSKVFTDD